MTTEQSSFPKNVEVDVVFDECQDRPYTYQPFATKVEDSKLQSNYCQLLIEEDCHYERNEILSRTMRSSKLSTSTSITPTKLIQLLNSSRHRSVQTASN